jgi:hypothetical protein
MAARRPGCGKTARSGAVPPATRTGIWVSKSFVPFQLIVMPVQLSKSWKDCWNSSASGLTIVVLI